MMMVRGLANTVDFIRMVKAAIHVVGPAQLEPVGVYMHAQGPCKVVQLTEVVQSGETAYH